LPHTVLRPNKLFATKDEATDYIFRLIGEEAAAKADRKKKGPWLPEAYY
jgi:hypothetical protein